MENILKKWNSKWFLLFLFMFLSLGMQAQWDENGTNLEEIDEIIEDDGSWDDYAPLDIITELPEVEINNDYHDDESFMDIPDFPEPDFPDDEPIDFPEDEQPPKDFTSDLDPKDCGPIVCTGYSRLVPEECKCVAIERPWYLDNDGDGWHSKIEPAIDSPGLNYKNTTSGEDCDDNNPAVTSNCYKYYYIDNDGDDWDSGMIFAKDDNGGKYKTSTSGSVCDDNPTTGGNVHKLNKCSKCEPEPVNGLCRGKDCDQILDGDSLTGETLAGIVGWEATEDGTTKDQIDKIAAFINKFAASYGLNSPEQRFHFYAQIAAETGGLTSLGEIPSGYASSKSTYKGRGILQLTGSGNYQAFQDYLITKNYNFDIMKNHNLLVTNMELAVLSALWYWDIGSNAKRYATDYSDDALLKVSKMVNCGSINSECGGNPKGLPNGWKERKKNAKRLKDCMN
jgi:predicted chitinase